MFGDKLFPEDNSMRLAMKYADGNIQKIRDHQVLTEAEAATMHKDHTEMLIGIVPPPAAVDVHNAITSAMTRHPAMTEADKSARSLRIEEQRVTTVEAIRTEHGSMSDRI